MPADETPRQKKHALYPVRSSAMAEKSRKSIEQAFPQDALADHAGRAEQYHFHRFAPPPAAHREPRLRPRATI
jgi:hypothetical protein